MVVIHRYEFNFYKIKIHSEPTGNLILIRLIFC